MAPNNPKPTMVVNKGTTELKIEVTPLSNCVWANAKKNEGKNELSKPAIKIHFQSRRPIFFILLKPSKNKKPDAKTIRKLPNCKGVRPISALFIRMNDDPQTRDRIIRYIHFLLYSFT